MTELLYKSWVSNTVDLKAQVLNFFIGWFFLLEDVQLGSLQQIVSVIQAEIMGADCL